LSGEINTCSHNSCDAYIKKEGKLKNIVETVRRDSVKEKQATNANKTGEPLTPRSIK
jgi:hypothetical protein